MDSLNAQPGQRATAPLSPLLWVTLLSLDAPGVAVLWQRLLARSVGTPLAGSVTVLLALAVWLIYVADRFLDTLPAPGPPREAARHGFYRRWRRAFALPFGGALLLAAWLALTRLPPRTFRHGLALLLAVGLYLFLVHLRKPAEAAGIPKELLVGILFGAGTSFPVWEQAGGARLLAPVGVFTALCCLNCVAIEYSEWGRLRQSHYARPHPWTVWLGRRLRWASGVTALAAAALLWAGGDWRPPAAEMLSAGAFILLDTQGEKIPLEKFRVLVDVALFTPLLFLPFAR